MIGGDVKKKTEARRQLGQLTRAELIARCLQAEENLDYERRKVSHRCIDAPCRECDEAHKKEWGTA